jgi:AmmeMemoRadiSam system protein B
MKFMEYKSAIGVAILIGLFLLLPGEARRQERGHIYAALVPHHLVADEIIKEVFIALQGQSFKRVILVAPNHFESGSSYIQASSRDWETLFGKVKGEDFFPKLPRASEEALLSEHGVFGLMPYIAKYLPDAKVLSVIVRYRTPDKELEELARSLAEFVKDGGVVVTTVDFSHYLPLPVAEKRDELTKRLLLELSEKPLYTLNNDYLDSPGALALMMKLCKKVGVQKFTLTGHTNSAIILSDPNLASTTSHFAGLCEEK